MKKLVLFLVALFAVVVEGRAQCPITISPAAPSTCSGVPIVLTASAANSYTWSANAGGANTATVSVAPLTNTTYTVTAFTGTCSATAVVTVNVNPLPIVTVNSTTLCATYAATLTAGGANTYTWSTGAQGASIVMSPPATTQYTVVGEDANGCMNFAVSTVTVLPTPTITVNSDAICSGSTILTATSNATTYTWSTNAGSVNTSTVNVVPASTTVYTITGGFANTCTAQATSTVYVNSSTVSITPPGGTYCTDVPYQFTGNANPGPILFWQWYSTPSANVNIQNPNQSGTNITFYQAGTYVLTCIANNSLGCRDSVLFPVSVTQTPTVSATPIAPIICLGGPGTTMFSTVTPNFGPTTYTWSGTGLIQYANGDSANINPTSAGIYTYTLTGTQNGCISEPTTITATVSPAPTPTIVVSKDTICAGSTTTFTVLGLPTGVSTYTWSAPQTAGLGTNSGYWSWGTPVFNAPYDTTFNYFTNFYVPGCPVYPTYTTNIVVLATPIVDPVSDTVDNCNKMGDSLQVTSIPPVSSGVTFTWTPSTGLSSTTGSSVFANPVNPMWYYVTPYYKGCPGLRDSIRMLIGDTTYAKIDAQYLIVCKGQPDTLAGLPMLNQLNGTYQYYWQPSIGPNAGTSINTTGDTIVINPIATQIYTLTVTGVCVKKQKTEITVYVNNCPTVVPSFTMNTDTICVNHCIYYEDLTHQTGNVLPLFYQWVFIGGTPVGITGQWTVHTDTAYYAATDSTLIPKIKVCYKINSSLNPNGMFPVILYVSHGVGTPTVAVSHSVQVDAGPLSNAGPNVTINLGDSTQLNGTGSTGNFVITQYTWSPPDSLHCDIPPWPTNYSCPKPWANPSETTTYFLTVKDKNGCVSTDSMTVYVDVKCFDPFIPSAFSPNNDGHNDFLYVRSNCLKNFQFMVFDRWGEKVFETTTLNFGWDGTFRGEPCNAGVFMWTLEGFLSNGKETKKHGSTTIIR